MLARRQQRHRDPAADDGGQLLLGEGLGQVIVHARRQAGFAVALQRVGGNRDHGQAALAAHLALVAPDLAGGRKAVHHRHLAIHQHRIPAAFVHGAQRFLAVFRAACFEAQAFQHRAGDFDVDRVVLGQQHAPRAFDRMRRGFLVAGHR